MHIYPHSSSFVDGRGAWASFMLGCLPQPLFRRNAGRGVPIVSDGIRWRPLIRSWTTKPVGSSLGEEELPAEFQIRCTGRRGEVCCENKITFCERSYAHCSICICVHSRMHTCACASHLTEGSARLNMIKHYRAGDVFELSLNSLWGQLLNEPIMVLHATGLDV